jgi:hypothetical protein
MRAQSGSLTKDISTGALQSWSAVSPFVVAHLENAASLGKADHVLPHRIWMHQWMEVRNQLLWHKPDMCLLKKQNRMAPGFMPSIRATEHATVSVGPADACRD